MPSLYSLLLKSFIAFVYLNYFSAFVIIPRNAENEVQDK